MACSDHHARALESQLPQQHWKVTQCPGSGTLFCGPALISTATTSLGSVARPHSCRAGGDCDCSTDSSPNKQARAAHGTPRICHAPDPAAGCEALANCNCPDYARSVIISLKLKLSLNANSRIDNICLQQTNLVCNFGRQGLSAFDDARVCIFDKVCQEQV